MRKNFTPSVLLFACLLFGALASNAQAPVGGPYVSPQLELNRFFLFGTTSVTTNSSTSIVGAGFVGSSKAINVAGNGNIGGGMYSSGTITLGSGVLTGNVQAENLYNISTALTSAGTVTGDVDVRGNANLSGATINGSVEATGTITGGTVSGTRSPGVLRSALDIQQLPAMPTPTVLAPFNDVVPTNNVLIPGKRYKTLGGDYAKNLTFTFNGPGEYFIEEVDLDGTNKFIYNFGSNPNGRFIVRVKDDMELGKFSAEYTGTGVTSPTDAARRIFFEVQGSGTAFEIDNGSSQATISRWLGTVYAPNGGIIIGAGTGNTVFFGAFWSGRGRTNVATNTSTRITLGSGVNGTFVPFEPFIQPTCTNPSVIITNGEGVVATNTPTNFTLNCEDADQKYTLTASPTNIPGTLTYTWEVVPVPGVASGNFFSSPGNSSSAIIASPGTYRVSVTNGLAGCTASYTVVVSSCVNEALNVVDLPAGQVVDPTTTAYYTKNGNPFQTTVNEEPLIETKGEGASQKLLVDIVIKAGQQTNALNYLNGATGVPKGFEQVAELALVSGVLITGWIFESALAEVNGKTEFFNYVRVSMTPQTSGQFKNRDLDVPATGIIVTGGDKAIAADLVRSGYGVGGKDVTIGVISDSYANLYTKNGIVDVAQYPDVINKDLPANVEVVEEYPAFGGDYRTDEGRAMLQIIHDIAPEASLKFQTGFISEIAMARGIVELANRGCQVIVDDITYVGAPYFSDGVIAKAINLVTAPTGTTPQAKDVKYFTSAGNFASRGHEDNFAEFTGTKPASIPSTSKIHDFGTTTPGVPSFLQQIRLNSPDPATYLLVLQWDDPFYSNGESGANNDLDVYLTDITGKPIKGFNRVNSAAATTTSAEFKSDPIEYLPFSVGGRTTINVMVVSKGGAAPNLSSLKFKFVVYRGKDVQFLRSNTTNASFDSSTIVGHARSTNTMAVAAAPYRPYSPNVKLNADIPEQFAASNAAITVEGFSSSGRPGENKPDFTAPDGVNTSVNLGIIGDIESDNNETPNRFNFYGTSAAAPHAAALAALILEAKSVYTNDPVLSNAGMKTLLKSSALPIGGNEHFRGSGLINGIEALKSIAKPTSTITRLIVPKTANGAAILNETITIEGFNIHPTSTVYIRDAQTPGVYDVAVNSTGTEITFKLSKYDGNPEVYVYTPPTVPALKTQDGGESNRVRLLDISKQPVVVEAFVQYDQLDPVTGQVTRPAKFFTSGANEIKYIYYGESIPEIKYRIRLNGEVVPGATLADFGIAATVFNNTATPNPAQSGVFFPGTYNILVELPASIAPEFTELYTYEDPINAKLRILKTPVKIKPLSGKIITFGQAFTKFDYEYEFPSDVYAEDRARVQALVESEYEPHISTELAILNGVEFKSDGKIIMNSFTKNGVLVSKIIGDGVAEVNNDDDGVAEVNNEDGVAEVNNEINISANAFSNIAFMATQAAMEDGVAEVNGTDDGVAEANEAEDGVAEANGFILDFRTLNTVLENIDGVAEVNTSDDGVAEVNNGEDGVAEVNTSGEDGVAEVNSGVYSANGVLISEAAPLVKGITVANAVPLFNGMVVINNFSDDGVAEVNGLPSEDGVAEVNNNDDGVAEVNNGSTLVNGIMVNVGFIDNDGVAEANAVTEDGVAEVNEGDEGVAEVNGIDGVAEVNGSSNQVSTGVRIVYFEDGRIQIFQNAAGAGYEDGVAEVNAEDGQDGVAEVNGQTINNAEFKLSEAAELMVILHSTDVNASTVTGLYKSVNAVTGITPGKKHVVIPGGFFTRNWDVTYGLGTFEVHKINATINAEDVNTTYDNTPKAVPVTVTGLQNKPIDNAIITITYKNQNGTPAYNSSEAPITAGMYDVTIVFKGDISYKSATKTVTLSIAKIDPIVTTVVDGGPGFVYTGSARTATGTVTGLGGVALEPSLTFTYSGTLFNGETYGTPGSGPANAGSYSVIGNFAGNDNYNALSSAAYPFTIGQATPVVNITGTTTVTYDGQEKSLSGTTTGVEADGNLAPALSITYNGSATQPINAGTYSVVGSFAGNNNYTSAVGNATLVIEKATPSIVVTNNQSYVFNGSARSMIGGTVNGVNGESNLTGELTYTYNGSSIAPTAVGTYTVVASYAGNSNYLPATRNDLSLSITPSTASISVVLPQPYTYNRSAIVPVVTVTGVNNEVLNPSLTFVYTGVNGTSYNAGTAPTNAGSYSVVVSYSGLANYSNGSSTARTFTIGKANATIAVTPMQQSYVFNGSARPMLGGTVNGVNGESNLTGALTYRYTGINGTVYSSTTVAPTQVGSYSVVANYAGNSNYNTATLNGLTLTITRIPVTVRANDVITNNGAIPVFTSTIVPSNAPLTVTYRVFNSNNVLMTNCTNLSPGLYRIEPFVSNPSNYQITYVNGQLYVNPFGWKVSSIKPRLECVTDNGNGTFFANYAYTNDNSVDVWINAGPDNFIQESTAGAVLDGGKPPTIFKKGGGRFRIRFDGSKNITWIVKSFERTQKTSSASSASSSSNKCGSSYVPPSSIKLQSGLTSESIRMEDRVYPNPFVGRVTIEADLTDVTVKDVKVIDLLGREFRPLSSRKLSATRMELDLSNLVTGQYYIRVNSKAGTKVFKVMRQ